MVNRTTPVRRDATETTARLLAAASAEFADRGYDGARIDRISAASGLNRALLFQRFGDKDGLYRAVITQVADEAVASRAALVSGRAAPRTRDEFATMLRDLARTTHGFLTGHPEAARILAWERASEWAAFSQVHSDADDIGAKTIVTWFRTAAERGWLRAGAGPDRQVRLVLELVSALHTENPAFIEDAVVAALLSEGGER